MTREFSDELLSAYLDGELGPDERTSVEQQLAASDADHQLLNELRMLRSDLAALPRAIVQPDFADRVVQAALAAQAQPAATVALPARSRIRSGHMAAAIAIGTAACLLLGFQVWWFGLWSSDTPEIAGRPRQPAVPVHSEPLADHEALVLRVRLPKGISVDAIDTVLSAAGIQWRTEATGTAAEVGQAYAQQLAERYGASPDLDAATVPASGALFVHAPLEQIEKAITALRDGHRESVQLAYAARVALTFSPPAEGELPKNASLTAIAQHLPATSFRLEKQISDDAGAALKSALSSVTSRTPVRVLILVE